MAEAQRWSDHVTTVAIANQLGLHHCPLHLGQVIEAIDSLQDRQIVREISGIAKSYGFSAQLYGHWLRHYKSLSNVVEVLALESPSGQA
jgi:hypothetical protein